MNKLFLLAIIAVIGSVLVPQSALSQFDEFDSIDENRNQLDSPTPTQGGVRIIIPEEEIESSSETAAEKKSSRPVLFGLAALFLVVVAAVAALALNPFGKTKHHGHKKL